jgi:hypothetical protein
MKPKLCAAGETLRSAINASYPDRDKRSDGWIADARHLSAGKSDHIADEDGIVYAIDLDKDLHGVPKPDEMPYLADQLRNLAKTDKRFKYLIFDGKIASAKSQWRWRKYTGINQHRAHLHVSFTSKGKEDSLPFQIPLLGAK